MASPQQRIVNLNVGGTRYSTSVSTMTKYPNSMLAIMVGQQAERCMIESGQELFIDRDGEIFKHILDYMRNEDRMVLPDDENALRKLLLEADFFQLNGLNALVTEHIMKFKVGDYVRLAITVPENNQGIPRFPDNIMANTKANRDIRASRASRGIFAYDDLYWSVLHCGHGYGSRDCAMFPSLENIRQMKILRGDANERDPMHNEWFGKIMALMDNCSIVKFYHEKVDDTNLRTGSLMVHVPQSILKKA